MSQLWPSKLWSGHLIESNRKQPQRSVGVYTRTIPVQSSLYLPSHKSFCVLEYWQEFCLMQAALCSLQYNWRTFADRKTNCRPIYLSEINYDGYLIKRKLVMGVYYIIACGGPLTSSLPSFYGCVFLFLLPVFLCWLPASARFQRWLYWKKSFPAFPKVNHLMLN